MTEEVEFCPDLFRGTAGYYERYRLGYPRPMVDDLVDRAAIGGAGRLLDLACGTGQITFAMSEHFADVWAVDQEPEMIEAVRETASAARLRHVRALVSTAEDLDARAESFELVAIGNAFHRLARDTVAGHAFRWLRPGCCVALLWSSTPWTGTEDWQRAMSVTLDRWKSRLGAHGRIPAGLDRIRAERPDAAILEEAGFEPTGSYRFPTDHAWTPEALVGFIYSTSFLSYPVLGDHAEAFAGDLRRVLHGYEHDGVLRERIDFAYEIARRPRYRSIIPVSGP